MNDTAHAPDAPPPDERDDIAVYALDALGPDEALAVDARLAADAGLAGHERVFGRAAAELAVALVAEATPRPDLRNDVLAAAFAARAGNPAVPASAVEIHRIEAERFVMLVRRLTPEQWSSSLDPPEFAGWTVHDLVAHLTANESLLARQLGITDPLAPETELDNEGRAAATIARHRGLTPADTAAELEMFVQAVDDRVSALTDDELLTDIEWWGMEMHVRTSLVVRAFELWTHADDIRRAVGLPQVAPPVPSVATMSQTAIGWSPLMLLVRGVDAGGRRVRVHFTGAVEATHAVDLIDGLIELRADEPVDLELTVDVVDFCRVVGDRTPAGGLAYEAVGDVELAAQLADAFSALATL